MSASHYLPGTVLGSRWRIERFIAQGGVASVYEAAQKNGLHVAIKRLHPRHLENETVRARFVREAQLANRISHPAVTRVLDEGEDEARCPFLVLEWISGVTLEEERTQRGGTIAWECVAAIGFELLSILEVAHKEGVIHRDLKPANMMRDTSGRLRVLDFGLGRLLEDECANDGLTSVDAVLGTVGFMSPEQARGLWNLVDERSDLWSVGATLWKLATGLDVHEGDTKQSQLATAATTPVAKLHARAPKLTPNQIAFFERALAYAQRDRFQHASDMQNALEVLARSTKPETTMLSSRPRVSGLAVVVVLAAGATLATAVHFARRPVIEKDVLPSPPASSNVALETASLPTPSVAPLPSATAPRPSSVGKSPARPASKATPSATTSSTSPAVNPLDRRN